LAANSPLSYASAMKLMPWIDAALSFVYPDLCQLCEEERATAAQGYVGCSCREGVHTIVPPFCDRCGLPFEGDITTEFECSNCREMELHFSSARSAVAARGPVLDAIHRYKYNGQMWFEDFLSELFIRGAHDWFRQHPTDALLPVPLFSVRERERGFNQAERLARRLSRAISVPVDARMLERVAATPTQTRLSRRERADNMRNAFRLLHPDKARGGTFVLVDDVFTTGATTSACARLLMKAGAERVTVWTVARAEFRG
jgi:ComF family protein